MFRRRNNAKHAHNWCTRSIHWPFIRICASLWRTILEKHWWRTVHCTNSLSLAVIHPVVGEQPIQQRGDRCEPENHLRFIQKMASKLTEGSGKERRRGSQHAWCIKTSYRGWSKEPLLVRVHQARAGYGVRNRERKTGRAQPGAM